MKEFFVEAFSGITVTDIIDILIVAFLAYKILGFIRETRAEQLIKGLLVLVVIMVLSDFFHLYALNWILRGTMTLGMVAIVIVFQPELRRGLEYLGRSRIIKTPFGQMDKEKAKHITSEFVKAIDSFSKNRVGALLVLEKETTLQDITETGTVLDAEISTELLANIFYEGAPLHDGAVLIRGDKVLAAGCVLPLTQNKTLGKELGTRHRAGIGITEHSDATVLIVSEETGIISMAVDGKLHRFLDTKTVEKTLLSFYLEGGDFQGRMAFLPEWLKKIRGKRDAEK